jgi:acyl-coenzyme A synthetase/AMP-(fatty) acid ligase
LAFGKLQRQNHASLKKIIYAGEVFSIEPLQQLMSKWKTASFYNFYGPTETNVCAAYALPQSVDEMKEIPIGHACNHMKIKLVETTRHYELWVTGDALMEGYFKARTAEVMETDVNGMVWYNTGDLVNKNEKDELYFTGRNDRMIKHHGYRIEPGEIENMALKNNAIKQSAALLVPKDENNILVLCYSGTQQGFLELKEYFSRSLPVYMVPDYFLYLENWPVTSTGKTDIMKLRAHASNI